MEVSEANANFANSHLSVSHDDTRNETTIINDQERDDDERGPSSLNAFNENINSQKKL